MLTSNIAASLRRSADSPAGMASHPADLPAPMMATGRYRAPMPTLFTSALVVAALLAAFVSRSIPVAVAALVAALLLVARHLPLLSSSRRIERQVSILYVLVLTAALPVAALRNETALLHYTVAIVAFGCAYVLTRDMVLYRRISEWVLWAALGLVFAYLATSGLGGFPLERMIPGWSSNAITSLLIVLQANACIARYFVKREASLLIPLLTLAVCLVGYGRGSILAAAIIVVVNVLALLAPGRSTRAGWLIALITATAIIAGLHYSDEIGLFLEANTKLGSGLYDFHRARIIDEYVNRLDGISLLIGADYWGTSIERVYNGNPHNSVIRAHHLFGIGYVLLVLAVPLLLMPHRLPLAATLYAGALLAVVLLRAFTEPVLFPTILDLFYFGSCLVVGKAQFAACAGSHPR
jgi:hypothetical protein